MTKLPFSLQNDLNVLNSNPFFSLYESTLLRNWNHSDSSKFKLWYFHAKLVILPILHSELFLFEIPILQCLDSIFDTSSLYSFEAKVLRVLLQLESPKSEHRNSLYIQNNWANLCSKLEPEFGLYMALL